MWEGYGGDVAGERYGGEAIMMGTQSMLLGTLQGWVREMRSESK